MNNFLLTLIAAISGSLLPLAFSPFNLFPIAFISPAILLSLWRYSPPLKSLWQSWVFGLGFFGIGASWVYFSIHNFGNANSFLASLITFLFVAFLALLFAFQGLCFSFFFRKKSPIFTALFAFPALWIIGEWERSLIFNGFPWLFMGYSQLKTPLSGYIPLFGVYGTSLIVVFINACIYLLFSHKKILIKILGTLFVLLLFLLGTSLSSTHWTQPKNQLLKVDLVQGNMTLWEKWDRKQLPDILNRYYSQSKKHWESDLIIWPETAIPYRPREVSSFLKGLADEAKEHNTAIIIGIPIDEEKNGQIFNGLIIIGNSQGNYLKTHLVPFGEYVPFLFANVMQYFDIPMSNLTPGPLHQSTLSIKGIPFATFICYEIAYSQEVLSKIKEKQFIVVISDDSWFGKSIASAQQLQIAQVRALETGRYILYGTNTGITAIITPLGKIQQSVPQHQETTLLGEIKPMLGETPLMKWGYYPVIVTIILFILLSFI